MVTVGGQAEAKFSKVCSLSSPHAGEYSPGRKGGWLSEVERSVFGVQFLFLRPAVAVSFRLVDGRLRIITTTILIVY
jgi:hypothetical protein